MSAAAAQCASCGGIGVGSGELEPDPLADDVRAGGEVAEPLAARAEQRREESRAAEERVDLDDADQRTHERVLEGDRSGVVADGAQPERHLADRLAAGQRLQSGREDDQRDDDRREDRDLDQGLVGLQRPRRGR